MAEEKDDDGGGGFEKEAFKMGWIPRDQYKGDPERFIEAEDFVTRGKEFIPILRANNRKLETELSSVKGEVQQLRTLLNAGKEAIEELTAHNTKATLTAATRHQRELKAALRAAEREGNETEVEQIETQLEEVDTTITEAKTKTTKGSRQDEPQEESPALKEWKKENAWYGEDKEKTAMANAMATTLRAEGISVVGKPFMAMVTERLKKYYPDEGENARSRSSRVGEGSRSNGGDTGSGRSYASLPKEAKEACERASLKVVGEGRAYKTIGDWRKKYVSDYEWE